MAGTGTSEAVLAARLWDTLLGSVVGLAAATILFPLRPPAELGVMDLGTGSANPLVMSVVSQDAGPGQCRSRNETFGQGGREDGLPVQHV